MKQGRTTNAVRSYPPGRVRYLAGKARRLVNGPRLYFGLLLSAVCFEGLGRKLAPSTPQWSWYFLKDGVLLLGIATIGIGRQEGRWARNLYRGFGPVLAAAFAWTLIQMANPEQGSIVLALVGLRSYWLWWLAPIVVARALRAEKDWRAAGVILSVVAIVAGIYATIQFDSSPEAPINRYAWNAEMMGIASVAATGKVRVTSTFSYLSGFANLAIIAVPMLLAVSLSGRQRWRTGVNLAGAAALAVTVPMTGSRGPVILVAAGALTVLWASGFLATRRGRRLVMAVAAMVGLTWLGSRAAVEGVGSRFRYDDTGERMSQVLEIIPPVALWVNDYPAFGIGTGMQQNARIPLSVATPYYAEGEAGRYLIELGPLDTCSSGVLASDWW